MTSITKITAVNDFMVQKEVNLMIRHDFVEPK